MRRYAKKSTEEEEEDPKQQIRTRYLLEVKAAYMEHYEEGLLHPDSLQILENSINEALDLTHEPLYDWHVLNSLFKHNSFRLRLGLYC